MKILTRDDTEYDEEYVLHSEALEEIQALRAEIGRLNGQRIDLQWQVARLQDQCARAGVEARRAERERLRQATTPRLTE